MLYILSIYIFFSCTTVVQFRTSGKTKCQHFKLQFFDRNIFCKKKQKTSQHIVLTVLIFISFCIFFLIKQGKGYNLENMSVSNSLVHLSVLLCKMTKIGCPQNYVNLYYPSAQPNLWAFNKGVLSLTYVIYEK